jgi:hypothetical protein
MMGVTTDQAIARVRARLNAGSYAFSLYYQGDDAIILPDTPTPFAYIAFDHMGSVLAGFGGGRGRNLYRNRMQVIGYVFSPMGYGAETVAANAETIAAQLRSYRDDVISIFDAPVIPFGPGSGLAVPGLATDVSNYQCAFVEASMTYDLIG